MNIQKAFNLSQVNAPITGVDLVKKEKGWEMIESIQDVAKARVLPAANQQPTAILAEREDDWELLAAEPAEKEDDWDLVEEPANKPVAQEPEQIVVVHDPRRLAQVAGNAVIEQPEPEQQGGYYDPTGEAIVRREIQQLDNRQNAGPVQVLPAPTSLAKGLVSWIRSGANTLIGGLFDDPKTIDKAAERANGWIDRATERTLDVVTEPVRQELGVDLRPIPFNPELDAHPTNPTFVEMAQRRIQPAMNVLKPALAICGWVAGYLPFGSATAAAYYMAPTQAQTDHVVLAGAAGVATNSATVAAATYAQASGPQGVASDAWSITKMALPSRLTGALEKVGGGIKTAVKVAVILPAKIARNAYNKYKEEPAEDFVEVTQQEVQDAPEEPYKLSTIEQLRNQYQRPLTQVAQTTATQAAALGTVVAIGSVSGPGGWIAATLLKQSGRRAIQLIGNLVGTTLAKGRGFMTAYGSGLVAGYVPSLAHRAWTWITGR